MFTHPRALEHCWATRASGPRRGKNQAAGTRTWTGRPTARRRTPRRRRPRLGGFEADGGGGEHLGVLRVIRRAPGGASLTPRRSSSRTPSLLRRQLRRSDLAKVWQSPLVRALPPRLHTRNREYERSNGVVLSRVHEGLSLSLCP